jgi:hypothetical protein
MIDPPYGIFDVLARRGLIDFAGAASARRAMRLDRAGDEFEQREARSIRASRQSSGAVSACTVTSVSSAESSVDHNALKQRHGHGRTSSRQRIFAHEVGIGRKPAAFGSREGHWSM